MPIKLKNLLAENMHRFGNKNLTESNDVVKYTTEKDFNLGKSGSDITLYENNIFIQTTNKPYVAVCEVPDIHWLAQGSGFYSVTGYTFPMEDSMPLRLEFYCNQVLNPEPRYNDSKSKLQLIIRASKTHNGIKKEIEKSFAVYNNELEAALTNIFC